MFWKCTVLCGKMQSTVMHTLPYMMSGKIQVSVIAEALLALVRMQGRKAMGGEGERGGGAFRADWRLGMGQTKGGTG